MARGIGEHNPSVGDSNLPLRTLSVYILVFIYHLNHNEIIFAVTSDDILRRSLLGVIPPIDLKGQVINPSPLKVFPIS